MQTILICLSIITLILSSIFLFKSKKGEMRWWQLTLLWIPTLICLILVGYRWQFLPLIIGLFLVTIFYLLKKNTTKNSVIKTMLLSLFLVLFSVVSIVPQWLFPYFQFEKPTGEYKVGVVRDFAVDDSRKVTSDKGEEINRELPLKIYYPAKVTNEKMLPYSDGMSDLSNALSKAQGFPALFTKHFGTIKTNAYLDAEAINSQFPLIFFSHGMGSYGMQSTFQMAELASQGYIVVSIEHPEDAAISKTSNGTVIPYKSPKVLGANQEDLTYLNDHNIEWQKDFDKTVTYLETKQSDKILMNADFNKIGYLGFSYGGATAIQSLMTNDKLKAAIDLDGALFGTDIPDSGITKPFLLINSEASINSAKGNPKQTNEEAAYFKELERKNNRVKGELVEKKVLKDSNHVSFTDLSRASSLLNEKNGDPMKNYIEINKMVIDFFNQYLK